MEIGVIGIYREKARYPIECRDQGRQVGGSIEREQGGFPV